jgi:hypothetical protein
VLACYGFSCAVKKKLICDEDWFVSCSKNKTDEEAGDGSRWKSLVTTPISARSYSAPCCPFPLVLMPATADGRDTQNHERERSSEDKGMEAGEGDLSRVTPPTPKTISGGRGPSPLPSPFLLPCNCIPVPTSSSSLGGPRAYAVARVHQPDQTRPSFLCAPNCRAGLLASRTYGVDAYY